MLVWVVGVTCVEVAKEVRTWVMGTATKLLTMFVVVVVVVEVKTTCCCDAPVPV